MRLWGGQPSDEVSATVTFPKTNELQQDLSFAPEEWTLTKRVTFSVDESFTSSDLDRLSAQLSSNDPNFNEKYLQYKATGTGEKSQFVKDKEETDNTDQSFTFELGKDFEINEIIQTELPEEVTFISSLNTKLGFADSL